MGKYLILVLSFVFIFNSEAADFTEKLSLDQDPQLFSTPGREGRMPFVRAIDQAKHEVRLYMYRLTDPLMLKSLISAKARGLRVRVLLDPSMSNGKLVTESIKKLTDGGVEVHTGDPRYSMTHAKTLILDQERALVTTMNLTWTFNYSRGLGLDVTDQSIATELVRNFDLDWDEAQKKKDKPVWGKNPAAQVGDANLIWSPDNSEARLIQMVNDAKTSIEVMVENLGATPLLQAFGDAVKRGVRVMVLVPLCTTSSTPLHNWDYMQKLMLDKVEIRNMPIPYSEEHPYTHAKAMVVDGKIAYLGSMNFSKNSLQKSREVGIVFDNAQSVTELQKIWSEDWQKAGPPPGTVSAATCPEDLVSKASR